MNATFFETSNEKTNSNDLEIKSGNFFLKNKIINVNTTKLIINKGTAKTPETKGSMSSESIPISSSNPITELFDAIRAGKTTETKLIRTIMRENRKTTQDIEFCFL